MSHFSAMNKRSLTYMMRVKYSTVHHLKWWIILIFKDKFLMPENLHKIKKEKGWITNS